VDASTVAVTAGGVLSVGVAVFHVFFWRLFRWREQLPKLSSVNRGAMQAMNVTLIVAFAGLGVVSIAFAADLVSTGLGTALLVVLALMWAIRTAIHPILFRLDRAGSVLLFIVFGLLAAAYAAPLVLPS
jgi:hypothetical protein